MKIHFTERIDEFGMVQVEGAVHLRAGAKVDAACLHSAIIDVKALTHGEITKAIDNLVYGEARLQLRELRHAVGLLGRCASYEASAEMDRVRDLLNGMEAHLQIEWEGEASGAE